MNGNEIRAAIRNFLGLLESDDLSVEQTEEKLPLLLDHLAFAQSFVSFTYDDTDYPDAPDQDYDKLRTTVTMRFPNYGYYNVSEKITTDIGDSGTLVGDAIDDLTEIARDLYEVEWYWSNTSEANALFYFENDFKHHWRQHLRNLQLYLDALKRERNVSE